MVGTNVASDALSNLSSAGVMEGDALDKYLLRMPGAFAAYA
jgi:hypothetical protein